MLRSRVREQNNDRTEDILASLARMQREAQQIEQLNDLAQQRVTDIARRCGELQQQVIAVTGYEYGREQVTA